MKTIEKEYDSMKIEIEELRKKEAELRNEVSVFKSVIETKDEMLAEYSKMGDKEIIKKKEDEFTKRIEELEKQISGLKKENQEINGELIIKKEQAESIEKKYADLQREYETNKKPLNEGDFNTISKGTMSIMGGNTMESDLLMNKPTNDIGNVIMRAHAKIRQMSDCVKKLLEGQMSDTPKFAIVLSKYQKLTEILLEADRELGPCKTPTPSMRHQRQSVQLCDLPMQMISATVGMNSDKENKVDVNSKLYKLNDCEISLGDAKKTGNQNAFMRRASALMRPSSAMTNHKGNFLFLITYSYQYTIKYGYL